MSVPINPVHRLLLEDNSSYLLLEDNTSKLILDEEIALDDPLNAGTVSSVTPGLTFVGQQLVAPPLLVQSNAGENAGSVTSMSLAFNASNTAGNCLVAIARVGTQPATATITDSMGNTTWQRVDTQTDTTSGNDYSVWIAPNSKAGLNTVNFTSSAAGSLRLIIAEYANVDTISPLDHFISAKGTGTAAASGTITPSQNNSLILGWFGTGAGNTITPTGSLIQEERVPVAATTRIALHDYTQLTAATLQATATYGSSDTQWIAGIISLKPKAPSNLTYEIEVDTVNTFDSTVVGTAPATPTLVGSVGAVSVGGSGASVTPAWGSGSSQTTSNLLICWVTGTVTNTNISTPAGWSIGYGQRGSSVSTFVFYKVAAGGDAAPTITGLASVILSAQLAEFSGVATTSPKDAVASAATTTTSPITVTASPNDSTSGELVIGGNGIFYSVSSTETLSVAMNNGATANATTSAAINTASHYAFAWGVTTGNSVATNEALTFTTTNLTGAAAGVVTFKAGTVDVLGPLLDKTSDLNIGFVDDTTTALADDRLLLEDGVSYLLLEDNSSKLAINYSYPSSDYVTYNVPAATLSNGSTYYWRVRDKPTSGAYGAWSEIRSFTVSSGASASVAQVAATVTASGGTQTVVSVSSATIAQVAGTVTAAGGTQTIATVNNVALSQIAASVTASGGTQVIATVNNVAISQVAASVTAAGGTQAVASVAINSIAITQVAGSVTATGGTQAVSAIIIASASVTQVAANVTATGGTQVVATSNFVALSQSAANVTASGGTQLAQTNSSNAQVAANVTATGGTQTIATSNFVALSQVAGTVTASGGTQTIITLQNASVTQLAGTVTASGGTQTIATVNNVAIAQLAGAVTVSGGSQGINSIQDASVAQLAATVTAGGGTQVIITLQNGTVTQVGANVTASGGTQIVQTNALITQSAANVTNTGGTQAIATVNNVSIAQVAGTVTSSGGTQSIATINNGVVAQSAASVTASGGTQSVSTSNFTAITQLAGTVTASGGTQTLTAMINAFIAQEAANITASGGVQSIFASSGSTNVAITQLAGAVTASVGVPVITTSTGPLPKPKSPSTIFLTDGHVAVKLGGSIYLPL